MHDTVEVPEPPLMLLELSVQVSPVLGEMDVKRLTVPVKLFVGATVIVEVPWTPLFTLTLVGLTLSVKSGTAVTVTVTLAAGLVLAL